MLASLLLATALSSPTGQPPEEDYRARPGAPIYSALAVVEPETGRIETGWRFQIVAEEELDELDLLLNGAFTITELGAEGLAGWSREAYDQNEDWDRIRLDFEPAVAAGESIELTIAYQGTPVMPDDGINAVRTDWVELSVDSAWHPMIASFDQSLTGRLELRLPTDWDVIASGEVERDYAGFVIHNRIPQLDVTFTAAPSLEALHRERFVVYHQGTDRALLNQLLAIAHACADYLDRRFGGDDSDRLPPGAFVLAPREESGYARKNYFVLTDLRGRSPVALHEFICHELAHYWSTGAPANTAENWLNEGFAVFVAARSVRRFYGDSAYAERLSDWRERARDAGPVWTPEMSGRSGYAVQYKKAPLKLHQLEQHIGEAAMDELVATYMTRRMSHTAELLEALERIAGAEARARFEAALAE